MSEGEEIWNEIKEVILIPFFVVPILVSGYSLMLTVPKPPTLIDSQRQREK